MIAIVCGGRDYSNAQRLAQVLDAAVVRLGLECIIEGAEPKGADTLAHEWAKARGDIRWIRVPADWDSSPKGAGPIRNRLMLDILQAAPPGSEIAVIAFPGGRGTANMVTQARGKSVKVIEIDKG